MYNEHTHSKMSSKLLLAIGHVTPGLGSTSKICEGLLNAIKSPSPI